MTVFGKAISAFALLTLVLIGGLSFWSEVRNETDREWVTHTLLVVEKLQAVRIDITQAEIGQRGYMLTGQERYLELYRDGVSRVREDMTALPELTADNPTQQKAILHLKPLVTSRLAELTDGIEVRKYSGLSTGVELVTRSSNGEKWMGQIAAQIAEMRSTEAQLLRTRMETAAASTRKMKFLIFGGNGLAVLILLIKGFVIHRETGRRNRAEICLQQANNRLEGRTAELLEANTEMESFAYSVAHDLRAPLRHIAGYSGILAEDCASSFDEEGRRYLGKIGDGAQKMGHLVDDLLTLSRIGKQELSLQPTALDPIVRQVIEELTPDCAGREVEWQIGDLSNAQCDPGLLKQVFVNVLSNAVKYTRKREHAVIQVGELTQNDQHVVFVRDNGVGFEMDHASKLFGVFQRLHKAEDFEGTGVGLAIVERIIRKHGWRIWAEAEFDRGATFFWTLGATGDPASIPGKTPDREKEAEASPCEELVHVQQS